MQTRQSRVRVLGVFFACLLVRLIPFRAPNIEPILSMQMPFAKRYGALTAFVFGFASIALYDGVTLRVGMWTVVTALAYGMLGVLSNMYFKNRSASQKNFLVAAVFGTLLYDALTGLSIGPLFFHQSFAMAIAGQIPFTALHLLGNVVFAYLLSPAIYRWLIYDPAPTPASVSLSLIPSPYI